MDRIVGSLKYMESFRLRDKSKYKNRMKNEEKKSRVERLISSQKTKITSVSSKIEQTSKSIIREERKRTKVEKSSKESRIEKRHSERVRRKEQKLPHEESQEKAFKELQDSSKEKDMPERKSSLPKQEIIETILNKERIDDNKILDTQQFPEDKETDVRILPSEPEQPEELRESSLVSVESGIILGDERESSLEVEQIKTEIIKKDEPSKAELATKEEANKEIQKRVPQESSEKVKKYKKPTVQPRIDTGSGRVDRKFTSEKKIERQKKEVKEKLLLEIF